MRYGSEWPTVRAGALNPATKSRRKNLQSISTEELALGAMRRSPTSSVPASIYAHASADPDKSFYAKRDADERHIIMTTEISVKSCMREGHDADT